MNNNEFTGGFAGNLITTVGAALSVTELQAVISIIVTIAGFLLTLTTTVILPAVRKWREIKKDGKITPQEMDQFNKELQNNIDSLNKK